MDPQDPRLFADPRGVWRDDGAGRVHGIRWHDIDGIDGYAIDAADRKLVFVELGTAAGERLELRTDWPGYREVATALAVHLPGLDVEALHRLEQTRAEDPPTILWWKD
jgi:hypothetical protein